MVVPGYKFPKVCTACGKHEPRAYNIKRIYECGHVYLCMPCVDKGNIAKRCAVPDCPKPRLNPTFLYRSQVEKVDDSKLSPSAALLMKDLQQPPEQPAVRPVLAHPIRNAFTCKFCSEHVPAGGFLAHLNACSAKNLKAMAELTVAITALTSPEHDPLKRRLCEELVEQKKKNRILVELYDL